MLLVYVLAILYISASVFIWPSPIAYFNEIVGGPDNGYNYLVDSNLDWGQDLKGLKTYMEENEIEKIKLSYFGRDLPERYKIEYENLDCNYTKGIMAVSASHIQGIGLENKECYSWLKNYEPIEKIGYSIFIYNIPN